MFGKELQFGLNDYSRQKVLNEKESVAQVLLNLLFMKPGQMPSMPHLGIDIREYLYDFDNEIDVNHIKDKIISQCSELMPYMDLGGMRIAVIDYHGVSTLFFNIPIYVEEKKTTMLLGINKKSNGEVLFNYQFDDNKLI